MSDVTIPADVAQQIATWLRFRGKIAWSDMLDPPPPLWQRAFDDRSTLGDDDPPAPSLRDEVAEVIRDGMGYDGVGLEPDSRFGYPTADAVLAVMRKRIEALPVMHVPTNEWLRRDDVLVLLGGKS